MNGQSVVVSVALVIMLHLVESMGGRIPLRPEDKYHSIDRRDGHNIASSRIIRSLRSTNDEDPVNLGALGTPPSLAKPNQGAADKTNGNDYDYADDSYILDVLPSAAEQPGSKLDSSSHFIKSSLYEDYEFDVTGTDQVDDEDDFLRDNYGPQSRLPVHDEPHSFLWLTEDDGWNESGYLDDPSDYDEYSDTNSDDYDDSQNEW